MTGEKKYTLTVAASTHHLSEVRDFVAGHASKYGFADSDISDIRLAVDEAFTNIIKHAYKYDSSKLVTIRIGHRNDQIQITLIDKGQTFDEESWSRPDIIRQVREKKRGGVGVYLIRELMDEVEYVEGDDSNEIHIYKKKRS